MGLGALFLYSFLVTGYYRAVLPLDNSASVVAVAVIPPFTIWTVSKQFNKRLVKLIAEEKVAESYVQIKFYQGSEEFYREYDEDVREALDDMDEKFHHQIVNILSGTFIALTAPLLAIIEFSEFGYVGVAGGLGISLAVGYVLGVASYRRIKEILDYSVRASKGTNEA